MDHSSTEVRGFQFTSSSNTLEGVVHIPVKPDNSALILIHGWGTCRLGPERMFVRFARECAANRLTVFAFDLPGRGESTGDESNVTLEDMSQAVIDCHAYIRAAFPHITKTGLAGLCSGGNTAVSASVKTGADFLILWSTFPFSTDPKKGGDISGVLRRAYVYLIKLLNPSTWFRLIRGEIRLKRVVNNISGTADKEFQHLKYSQENVMDSWKEFREPILFVFGENDPEAQPSLEYYRSFCDEHGLNAEFVLIPEASHNFYRKEWQGELFRKTSEFIQKIQGNGE